MLIFFESLHIYIYILFGTKSHHTIFSNYVMIFKVNAKMSEIFADFSRKNSHPLTLIGQKLLILLFLSKIGDVPAGCLSNFMQLLFLQIKAN